MASWFLLSILTLMLGLPGGNTNAPVPANEKGAAGPPLILQTASVDTLLRTAKSIAKTVGGPTAGDMLVQQIDAAIQETLGEKGFAGIDTKKPILAYMYIPDNANLFAMEPGGEISDENLKLLKAAILIPAASEDAFRDFVDRLFKEYRVDGSSVALTKIEGEDGLWKIDNPKDPAPVPIRARFIEGYMHIGINLTNEEMAPSNLPKPETLVNPKETGLVVLRAITERYPASLMKNAMEQIDSSIKQLKEQIPEGQQLGFAEKALTAYVSMSRRYADQLMKESREGGYRLVYDEKTGTAAYEVYLIPKPGTSLAKDIADRKPTTNTFAGMITQETAAAVTLQMPLFAQEIRDILFDLTEEGRKQVDDNVPPPAVPVVDELLQGLGRTVKSGDFDILAALQGPDKEGHYTLIAGIAYDDAPKLEAALKKAAKDAPKEVTDVIEFDAAKVGDVNVHIITPPQPPPPPADDIFGANTIYVAFAPKGIYVAFGTQALPTLKAALTAKPKEAHAFDIAANPKRMRPLLDMIAGEQAGKMLEQTIGADDQLLSMQHVSIAGGSELTIRIGFNLRVLAPAIMGARVTEQVRPPVGAVAVPVQVAPAIGKK